MDETCSACVRENPSNSPYANGVGDCLENHPYYGYQDGNINFPEMCGGLQTMERREFKDHLAEMRQLAGRLEDHSFPIGDFVGENITRTDYQAPPMPEIDMWKKRERRLDLPPFVGITNHQTSYQPPLMGPHGRPKVNYRVDQCRRIGIDVKDQGDTRCMKRPIEFLKDFRRMDYNTTHQNSFTPPPDSAYVHERALMFKWPLLSCDGFNPSYKSSSIYQTDYVYYETDPTKPEYVTAAKELIEINPHPKIKF